MKDFFKKYRYHLAAIVCLVFFALWSKYVDRSAVLSLDFAVTVKIQDKVAAFAGNRLDGFFEDIGFLASPIVSTVIVLVFTAFIFIQKKSWKGKIAVVIIPMAFFIMTAAEIYGKSVVHHPAPPYFMLKNPTTIFPTYHVWEEFSYPSGHAARAVFLAISSFLFLTSHVFHLNKRKRNSIGIIFLGYIILIGVSRIYLGHHWFSDIVGGVSLGLAFALLSRGIL